MSFAIWITGPPGSGKSTIARRVAERLAEAGRPVRVLELDEIRKVVTPEPAYTDAERDVVYRALAYMAKLLVEAGVPVLVDATAHRRAWRDLGRRLIRRFGEVELECPLEVRMARERSRREGHAPRGIYARGAEPWATVPGVNVPYERSAAPELRLDTASSDPESQVRSVVALARRIDAAAAASPTPAERDDPPAAKRAQEVVMQSRILVVGDEPELVSVFRTLCDALSYEVVFAADRGAAWRVLATERAPDVVVLDEVVAEGSGLELCRELKAARPGLPVLLVTSNLSGLEAAQAAGVDMALGKPVEPAQARDAVSWLVGRAGGAPAAGAPAAGAPGARAPAAGTPARRLAVDLVLAPVDFSPGSEAAAAYASWLAGRLGARVRLLYVVAGPGAAVAGASPAAWAELMAAQQRVREEARQALGEVAARLTREAGVPAGTEPETEVAVAEASTAETIVRVAREGGADLIAVGTHGRSGLGRLVLGSVAEQVLRSAGCPVLVLRGPR